MWPEIRTESLALEKLKSAKNIDTCFVPLDYDYGQNYQGKRTKNGFSTPDEYKEKIRNKTYIKRISK